MATNMQGRRQYDDRSSRIIANVDDRVILLDEDIQSAGFMVFYNKCKAVPTLTERFDWDVDAFLPTTDTTTASATAAATVISVTTPVVYIRGATWMNKRTGELFRVEDVDTSGAQITVTRAISALNSGGGTAAAAMNSGDTLIRLATAVGEDNRRQTPQHTIPAGVYNLAQYFRRDLTMSERQIKRQFETNSAELPAEMRKQMLEFRKEMNMAFLYNERARFTGSEGDTTVTSGIRPVITTNTYAVGGTLYKSDFDDWLREEGLKKGSRNKFMFSSSAVIGAVTEMADAFLTHNVDVGTQKISLGYEVMKYTAPNGGTLMIVEDRTMSDNFDGEAYVIDMSQLQRRHFSNHGRSGQIQLRTNTQDADDVGEASTLTADMGLQYGAEAAHGKLTGVTGGASGRSLS